jgi:TolA-binding protein
MSRDVTRMVNEISLVALILLLALVFASPAAGRVRGSFSGPKAFLAGQEQDAQESEQDKRDREQQARDREQEKRDREQEARDREQEKRDREQERLDRQSELYDGAREDLDDDRYEKAEAKFDRLAQMNGPQTDAALYWKAYTENRQGKRDSALATVAEFKRRFPQSRWLRDLNALELEVKQSTGQKPRPEAQEDDE